MKHRIDVTWIWKSAVKPDQEGNYESVDPINRHHVGLSSNSIVLEQTVVNGQEHIDLRLMLGQIGQRQIYL